MLEFIQEDSESRFYDDAATLKDLIGQYD
jgi:hypothetical protein